jgi:hypothetical protein
MSWEAARALLASSLAMFFSLSDIVEMTRPDGGQNIEAKRVKFKKSKTRGNIEGGRGYGPDKERPKASAWTDCSQ